MPSKANPQPASMPATIFMTVLVAVFALVGTPPLVHGIMRLLPTQETGVEVVRWFERDSSGFNARGAGRSKGTSCFVRFRYPGGVERNVEVPRKVHGRMVGMKTAGSTFRLRTTSIGNKPTVLLVSKPSILKIDPGSVLDRAIRGKDAVARPRNVTMEEYDLLVPVTGLFIASLFCWLIVGFLLWKMPPSLRVRWPIIAAGLCVAIGLGTWWGLAT